MISLRREQVDAFDSYMRDNFIERMVGHLRRSFPNQCASETDETLRRRVSRAMDRCAEYEIRKERDVARFVDVGMVFGETFDTDCEWAAAYLKQSIDSSAKMKLVFEEARRKARP